MEKTRPRIGRLQTSRLHIRLLMLSALILLPIMLLTFYTASEQRNISSDAARSNVLVLTQNVSTYYEQLVRSGEQLITALAQIPAVRDQDGAACTALFAQLLAQFEYYTNIFVVNTDGETLCTGLPGTTASNVSDASWFVRAMQERAFSVSDFRRGIVTGRPVVTMSAPLFAPEDPARIEAFVALSLDLEWVSDFMSETALPTGSTITAIDSEGIVLYRNPDGEAWIGRNVSESPFVQARRALTRGTMEGRGLDDVERLYGATVLDGPNNSVQLFVGIPSSVAFAQANRLLLESVFALGAVTAITIAIAWLGTAHFVVRPVYRLSEGARSLARGYLDSRMPLEEFSNTYELAQLARAFNEMAEALQMRQDELQRGRMNLEAEVQERTREISFLAEAGTRLAASLDYETTLATIMDLTVPAVADWCALELLDENGTPMQAALRHVDPAQEAIMHAMRTVYPLQADAGSPVWSLLKAGQPAGIVTPVSDEIARSLPLPAEVQELVARLDASKVLFLPLAVRGTPIGVMLLGVRPEMPNFAAGAVWFGKELARRVAVALDNNRLYRQTHAERERYEVTLASIADAVIAADREGRITFMNGVAETLLGCTRDEVAGRTLDEIYRIQEPQPNGVRRYLLLHTPAGGDLAIEHSSAPIRDEMGRINGQVIVFRDVTERIRQEERAEIQRDLAIALSEAVTPEEVGTAIAQKGKLAAGGHVAAVVQLTEDGEHIEFVSESTNYNPDAWRVVPLTIPAPLTDAVRTGSGIWISSSEEYHRRYPEVAGRALAITRSQAAIALPLTINERTIGAMAISFHKPQAFKDDERSFLLTMARQCAQALERARLFVSEQRARARAEAADNIKLRFLAMVSHELRTPLTSIKGFATTLLAPDIEWDLDSQLDFVKIISEEADKLSDLIEQLLDLSRLQAGTLSIRPEPQYLNTVVDTAMAQLRTLTEHHQLFVDLPPDLPLVHIDFQRIAQVIVNLVGNAARYTPKGTAITVSAEREDGVLRIDVQDEGPGIPPDQHELVFEAFRQATNRSSKKGAGLGLAICKGLIEAHHGSIWIQPTPPPGTTISFTLPLAVL